MYKTNIRTKVDQEEQGLEKNSDFANCEQKHCVVFAC